MPVWPGRSAPYERAVIRARSSHVVRNCAEIILHWPQRVVPLRLRLVPGQRKVFHFLSRYLFAFFVLLAQQTSTHLQSRQSRGGANVVEGRLKALQALSRPIFADLAGHTVFERIPFRGARGDSG